MTNQNKNSVPGMGALTDTFDFVKNLWGGMGMSGAPGMKIPGMVMPTLSVEEIDKQIKDLKSVESWLTINLNMLRGTIQALEVQSATITTIKSMSTSFTSAMQPETKQDAKPGVKPGAATPAEKSGKPIFKSPFTSPFAAPAAKPQKPQAEHEEEPPEDEMPDEEIPEDRAPAAPVQHVAPGSIAKNPKAGDAPPMANPAAWWGMLQDQFKQAVGNAAAMTPEKPAAPKAKAAKAESATKPQPAKTAKAIAAKKAAPVKTPAKRKAAPKA